LNCTYCKSNHVEIFKQKSIYKIYKCLACDFFFTYPASTNKQDKKLFSENYFKDDLDNLGYIDYEADKEFLKSSFKKRIKWLKKTLNFTDCNWLDFGCALGFGLEVLKEHGIKNPYGIDRINFAIDYAKNKLNINNVYTAKLISNIFPYKKFDYISFFDVLELTQNPLEILSDTVKHVKKNGFIIIDDWNPYSLTAKILKSHWHAIAPPNRMFYFSPYFLKKLLEKEGFYLYAKKSFGKTINLSAILIKLGINQPAIHKIQFLKKLSMYINLKDQNLYVFKKIN
jgi:2-polyprenyl-3-methyl-5-hydroxy-6-metoxy-1,4-benzoquinol methylase